MTEKFLELTRRAPFGRRFYLAALAITAFGLQGDRAGATVTETWKVDDYESFDKGEAKSSFITSLGEVRPGWSHTSTELEFNSAWASVLAGDGKVYIGTDDEGTIYEVDGDKVKKLAKVGEAVAVVSLVEGPKGTLYAGTMPDGEVWSVDTKDGKTKKLAALSDAETVWSLSYSQEGLYAGTGPNGHLFKVDTKGGRAQMVFDSEDKRIMSLLATKDGGIWFGTSDRALLFRHDAKSKKTRAVADFAGNEVSALAEWKGQIIAAANDLQPVKSTGVKTKDAVRKAAKKEKNGHEAKMPKTGTKPGADKETPPEVEPQPKKLRKGKGALYRVRGDGQLTQLHALTASYFTSVAVNDKDQIFAGAADKGRIYLVEDDDSVSTAIDVDQRYISQLHVAKNGELTFTTGDASALYRGSGNAKDAEYLSDILDAKTPARFGRLAWNASGPITIETRSGNTAEPGIGWSEWQATSEQLRGVGTNVRGKVQSPPGRYLQYRARFGDADSILRGTELYYLPANQASRLTEITIESDTSTSAITSKSSKPRSPILELKWKVDNDDKDKTIYDLSVRREGELRWRPIRTGSEPLTGTSYDWNTETFPDGHYRLRVRSSDRLSNTDQRALESSKTTAIFVVDNERPKVSGLRVRYPAVSARATDAVSTIAAVAYSIDDGPWLLGATRDGIFDDQSELIELKLSGDLEAGAHTLALRVADSAGNIGSQTQTFVVR